MKCSHLHNRDILCLHPTHRFHIIRHLIMIHWLSIRFLFLRSCTMVLMTSFRNISVPVAGCWVSAQTWMAPSLAGIRMKTATCPRLVCFCSPFIRHTPSTKCNTWSISVCLTWICLNVGDKAFSISTLWWIAWGICASMADVFQSLWCPICKPHHDSLEGSSSSECIRLEFVCSPDVINLHWVIQVTI